MIDLHAHVLPGIDDGPATMDEAITMLATMARQGIKRVVAGAHAMDSRHDASADAVLKATEAVNRRLCDLGVELEVLPGMELLLGFGTLQALKSGRAMGLNRSRYVLVELPAHEYPLYTERALYELMIAGYRPILNHPERNAGIQRHPDRMRRLAESGVGAAITAASLLGRMGGKAETLARRFLAEGVATVLVSDAHDLAHRAPLLGEALSMASALGKADQAAETEILS